ncbi:chromatin assembly factor 1 subunit A-domain-containing protein [Rhexocercosporidium sp. MPI-PUGE-AT-0058]|nr:chromatin assembly factor 1 subunit A-domain-containing protein [Rhexocercosporidium sp. MPI-PUGE-AT-0058]
MSLEEGSPCSRSLKRDYASFEEPGTVLETQEFEQVSAVPADLLEKDSSEGEKAIDSLPTPPISIDTSTNINTSIKRDTSPARSTTGSLTDAGSATPSRDQTPTPIAATATSDRPNPPPSAFAAMSGGGLGSGAQPLPKKARLSFQEKEMKRINKEIRDREKAEEKAKRDEDRARKDKEKQVLADEKARKDSEKAEEKARKEAERLAIADEKARKEAEKEAEKKKKEAEREEKRLASEADKAAKEEKRRKKEEEKLKAEEEKRKKERSQMKLGNFFTIPTTSRPRGSSVDSKGRTSMSPAPPSSNVSAAVASPMKTPGKPEKSAYEKMFPDFYIQQGVTVAPINRFERDEEAVGAIESMLDSYLLGNRSPGRQRTFDAPTLFHTSSTYDIPRGKQYVPVREIMSDFYSNNSATPVDLTTDSQNSQIKRSGLSLKVIPMKILHFQEDVRPPYRGTYTSRPINGMSKLARNPLRRDLPNTDYDYDSEAEWVQDDEDAEDLKSEGDEEEELGDDEDMDDFLDDENDETANSRRLVLQGDLEPVSTGLCWEDRKRRNSNVKMIAYRMEVILDPSIKSIDPFSTAYWDPPALTRTSMEPPRIPLNTMKSTSANINSLFAPKSTPTTDFVKSSSILTPSTLSSTPLFQQPAKPASKDAKPKKILSADDIPAFKAAIQGSDLSKVGLIEVLKKKFPGRPAAAIKGTLETVAKRVGVKEVDKRWVLLD